MEYKCKARWEMFGRVTTFGRTHISDLEGTDGSQHIDALESIYIDLGRAKAGQTGGSAAAKDVLLDALRPDIHNITRTASAWAQDDPGFDKLFRPPANANPAALLTATDTIIANLLDGPSDNDATKATKKARRQRFISLGLPAQFLQDLIEERAAIEAAQASEMKLDSEGVKNTALIGRLIAEGMKQANYLDAIFHNVFTENPEMLRAWQSASHIERAAQRNDKSETSAQPTQPPSASAKT